MHHSVYGKEGERNVLLINSYNQTYQSTADKITGIQNIFQANNVNFDVEYMDSKKYDTEEYKELFYELIKYKLKHFTTYDAILVSDDNALQFAMDYREDLFKNLPIVFMAVNDWDRAANAEKNYQINGVAENLSVKDNIDLGLIMNPSATQVVAIVDRTLTGIGDKKQFYQVEADYPKLHFRTIDISGYNKEELVNIFQKIREDSVVIFFDMNRDGDGRNYSITEAADILRENVSAPIIRIEAGGLGSGITGGKSVNYVRIGEAAAGMVVRILDGTPAENIPVD
jgi:hypothetical protein